MFPPFLFLFLFLVYCVMTISHEFTRARPPAAALLFDHMRSAERIDWIWPTWWSRDIENFIFFNKAAHFMKMIGQMAKLRKGFRNGHTIFTLRKWCLLEFIDVFLGRSGHVSSSRTWLRSRNDGAGAKARRKSTSDSESSFLNRYGPNLGPIFPRVSGKRRTEFKQQ